MLAKKYRLSWETRIDNRLFFSRSEFNLRIGQNGLSFNRAGVIVSKKIDKRAVVRNKIRRLIYVAVQELSEKTRKGLDFRFIIKKGAIGKSRKDFYNIIENLLKKEGFLD